MVQTEKISRVKAHTRYITEDGKRVPGVTTILGVIAKPALVRWANKMGLDGIDTNKYVDRLADIGTLAHYLIQCKLTNVEPDLSTWSPEQLDKATNSVKSFDAWAGQHAIEVIDTELALVSEKYRYGGTVDILARVDGVEGVVDLKTSKAIYDEHLYQAAAYHQLARENGYKPKFIQILQIGRTEEEGFSVRYVAGRKVTPYRRVFHAALKLYRQKQEAGRGGK